MDPLLEIITGNPAKNLNRAEDIDQNIKQVRSEFVGKPEVCHKLVTLIIYLRRNIDTEDNAEKFFALWEKYSEVLLRELDTRWLLSVVDTVIDVGDDLEAAVAMNISQCILFIFYTRKFNNSQYWKTNIVMSSFDLYMSGELFRQKNEKKKNIYVRLVVKYFSFLLMTVCVVCFGFRD